MCLKTRRRSSSRSKSKNVSSTASPLDLSGTRATSPSRSDDGQTPKCSIRRILGFKRKKASTCNNPSSDIQKAEAPPPSLPTIPASPLPAFPATGIAFDIPPLAHIPEPTVSPPPSPPAAPVSPPSVSPATVPPTPPTSSPTPAPMPEKTVSPPPSLPAAIVFPHPIPPAAVPPSYPTSLNHPAPTPESAAPVSAPSVSPATVPPTPALMPEETVSPPLSLPADVVFPHPIPPAAVPPSYPTSLNHPAPTPEPAAPVSAPSVSPEVALPYSGTDVPPPAYIQPKESSLKDIAQITWDGFTQVLEVVKESSDWNPFLKAALAGAVAVINLGKQVQGNWKEMASLLSRIERLQSILAMRKDTYRQGENRLSSFIQKCGTTFEQEVTELKDMQTHGRIRRVMQGTSDGDRLLGIYRCIKDILDDLQYAVGLSIEHDTSTIRQSVALDKLPVSVTAAHNAAIDHTTVSRQSCTKDTRLSIIQPILGWMLAPDSAPVYWLTGPAGVGKTTIAQTICRYITTPTGEYEDEAGSKELKERRLVSYFCSHQLDSGESKRLVPTLCRRLAEHSSSYARELVRALEKDSNLPHAELSAQLQGLLVGPWESSASRREGLPLPIIVVDALDENQGGFKFLDLLLNAVDGHKFDGLRFLLTSRTDPGIAERCKHFTQDVPEADVQHDITLYLEASLPKVKDELRRDLATRAGNLFIYASTVVKMTRRARGSEQDRIIRTVLQATSISRLDDLYAGIVHEVIYHENEAVQRSRLHVLHTVLRKHALYDPSPSNELIYQLSTAEEDVFSTVLDGLHAVMYEAEDGSILTYHASFPDFILRPPSSFNSSVYLNPLCDKGLHHAHLTRRCYEIMAEHLHFNMFNLESSFDLDEDIPDLQSRYETKIDPVLQYAVQYWMEHLQHSRPDEDNQGSIPLCDIPLAFIDNIFLYWFEVNNLIIDEYFIPDDTEKWIEQHCPEHSNIWEEMYWFCMIYDELHPSSTPHIYISLLSLWRPELHISKMWRPRFPHLPNVTLDGQRNPTDITGKELGPQDSKGDTGDGTLGDDNELVGVPPRRLDHKTGWVLSEDGSRIMWLPQTLDEDARQILRDYMILPAPDQISFDLQYLGRNWTRICEPPSSQ